MVDSVGDDSPGGHEEVCGKSGCGHARSDHGRDVGCLICWRTRNDLTTGIPDPRHPYQPAAPAPTLALNDARDAFKIVNVSTDPHRLQFAITGLTEFATAIRADERSRIAAEGCEGTDSARLAELEAAALDALEDIGNSYSGARHMEAVAKRARLRAALPQSPPTAAPADSKE